MLAVNVLIKKCITCREIKSWRRFRPGKLYVGGRTNLCKSCWANRARELYANATPEYKAKRLLQLIAYTTGYQKDPARGKIVSNLRSRFGHSVRRGAKSGSAVKLLGCSIEQFRTYLESKFSLGMSWDNWGRNTWHIDHVKPLSKFDLTDPEQLSRALHYTNLQPLWAAENLSKGARV
jgi:hypothetical protein